MLYSVYHCIVVFISILMPQGLFTVIVQATHRAPFPRVKVQICLSN